MNNHGSGPIERRLGAAVHSTAITSKSGPFPSYLEIVEPASLLIGGRSRLDGVRRPLRSAILGLDARLRRAQGIFEFSDKPDCLLRIAMIRAPSRVVLSDVVVERGDPVLDLHLFNEHLPRSRGRGLRWAVEFRRQLASSLEDLAVSIEDTPDLRPAKAIRADITSRWSRRPTELARRAACFGFETASYQDHKAGQGLHSLPEDLWLWALAWAFNPEALKHAAFFRWHAEAWISKQRLCDRFN